MAIGTAAAIVGGSVLGAIASDRAADAAAAGGDAAIAESRRQFDTQREDFLPFIRTGTSALDRLAQIYGLPRSRQETVTTNVNGAGSFGFPASFPVTTTRETFEADDPDLSPFFESPDFQFNLAEGQKAIDRSLAARGKALSGQGVKEGVRFASGLASNQFNNFVNRLASIAGIGQVAAGQSGAAGAASAGQVGNAAIAAGNARASGFQGINNSIQGGVGNLLLNRFLNQNPVVLN